MTDDGREIQSGTRARGIVVAGLSGGSGKSVVAVGLAAAFTRLGRKVVCFKKGPDYIDAGWLQLAAGSPCYNLDPYLMTKETIIDSFQVHAQEAERVIVEGNRGLYDGVDSDGAYSTAELSLLLGLPVLLVLDCTKTTRTMAAMVLGCQQLDPRVDIRGVVLNRLGSARHETIIRQSIERYTGIPVLGAFRRMTTDVFPQRHLGVTPYQEHEDAQKVGALLADMIERHTDLPAIDALLSDLRASKMSTGDVCPRWEVHTAGHPRVRIGVLKDAAFQFYYPDNLEALEREGADLVEVDALRTPELPELDCLYIGGGFPETSAGELAANRTFRESVKSGAEAGLPIYAECGGLIYLGESMSLGGKKYPLVGIFPIKFGLEKRPQAHGYTVLMVEGENPFYPKGMEIRGHEFRYSRVLDWPGKAADLALAMERGVGFIGKRDGLVYKNVMALYTHIHAAGVSQWAKSLVGKAKEYRISRESTRPPGAT